jgi:hypothetical protein
MAATQHHTSRNHTSLTDPRMEHALSRRPGTPADLELVAHLAAAVLGQKLAVMDLDGTATVVIAPEAAADAVLTALDTLGLYPYQDTRPGPGTTLAPTPEPAAASSPYDRDPAALAWARGKVEDVIAGVTRLLHLVGQTDSPADQALLVRYADWLRRDFLHSGPGLAAFDARHAQEIE